VIWLRENAGVLVLFAIAIVLGIDAVCSARDADAFMRAGLSPWAVEGRHP
jgi:hypothetical protein